MKRAVCLLAVLLMFSAVFADKYIVEGIKNSTGGNGIAKVNDSFLSLGYELKDTDYITIKDGYYILLKGGLEINQSGIVKDVVCKRTLHKSKIVKASKVAPEIDRVRPGVATAASRASEAKEDFDWDEGE